MKKIKISSGILFLIFLIHCNNTPSKDVKEIFIQPNNKIAQITFTKEKSLGLEILYPRIFIYKKDSSVFVYGYTKRSQKYVVMKYNEKLLFEFQKEFYFGDGPGDVSDGTTFSFCGDFIYAPDNTLLRVNIFDQNLNFIKFVHVLHPYYSTTFSEDGNVFYGINWNRVKKGYNIDFNRIEFPEIKKKLVLRTGTFWLWNENKKTIVGSYPGTSFFMRNGRVYFLNMMNYQLSLFDFWGHLLKMIRINVPIQKVPKEKKKEWLFDQEGDSGVKKCDLAEVIQPASWTVPLEKGFVVIRRKSYATVCLGLVEGDYFDFELNYVGKTQIPCFYNIFDISSRMPDSYIFHKGYLYLIVEDEESEEFYLEKWKVMEES